VTASPDLSVRYGLALQQHQAGRLAEAEAGYRQVLAVDPRHADSLNMLGVIAAQCGHPEAAIELMTQAIAADDGNADYHLNLGLTEQGRGRIEIAAACYRHALALRPDYPEAYCNLGFALDRQGQAGEAIAAFESALAQRPDYPNALAGLAAVLLQQGRLEESAARYDQAVALRPGHAESWYGLGAARHRLGRFDAALPCYEKAIALRPDYAEAHSNLALVLKNRGDMAGALAQLDRALTLKPDYAEAQMNQAMIRLLTGEFHAGWRQFEWRWQTRQLDADRRSFAVPRWDGAPGTGGTMLVWGEQGLGDSLQFCRYVPLLVEHGWRVVLDVPTVLVRLLQGMAGVTVLPLGGAAALSVDCHCPMMSLPLHFGTELASIPATIPYLAAPVAEIARWRRRLGDSGGRSKVGLVWAGNPGWLSAPHAEVDARRSIAFDSLAPLLAVAGIRFVSLQKDRRPGEEPAAHGLVDVMAEVEDFADTAAIIADLDLVIAVDTAVVHLAGALGKPVWLINRFHPCWRWLLGRDDSPWYPTLRQFRQPAPGDWDSAIAEVAAALTGLAAEQRR
jgi:tetratricopeptide (TPR) repeat protein